MGAHRRARSARAAARVALCVVALLAAASGASAVSLSETDKRAARRIAPRARKARLREELAAAELATREKYEAKVSSLERTTERLRREAEETVASLSAERDAGPKLDQIQAPGLLNLDAKRKSETETLRAETERLRAEREELQSKLEQALDDALSLRRRLPRTRNARARFRHRAPRKRRAPPRRRDETSTRFPASFDLDARSSSSAAIGLVAGVAETVSRRARARARVSRHARATRYVPERAQSHRRRRARRRVAPACGDRHRRRAAACLAAVVAAAALGALAAKGASAAERLARGAASWVSARASDDWMGFWGSLGAGRVGRRTRPPRVSERRVALGGAALGERRERRVRAWSTTTHRIRRSRARPPAPPRTPRGRSTPPPRRLSARCAPRVRSEKTRRGLGARRRAPARSRAPARIPRGGLPPARTRRGFLRVRLLRRLRLPRLSAARSRLSAPLRRPRSKSEKRKAAKRRRQKRLAGVVAAASRRRVEIRAAATGRGARHAQDRARWTRRDARPGTNLGARARNARLAKGGKDERRVRRRRSTTSTTPRTEKSAEETARSGVETPPAAERARAPGFPPLGWSELIRRLRLPSLRNPRERDERVARAHAGAGGGGRAHARERRQRELRGPRRRCASSLFSLGTAPRARGPR